MQVAAIPVHLEPKGPISSSSSSLSSLALKINLLVKTEPLASPVAFLRTIMAEHFGALSLPVGEFLALEHGTEFVG